MGKIINSTYMTLDGDITNMEAWHFGYLGDDSMRVVHDQLLASDAVIMGRATYDGFFPAWSQRGDADELSARMNSIRKYVVSSTLTDPEWTNTVVLSANVAEQIRQIRREQNLVQYGFGDVTRLMLAEGLLDEFRIWLHPVLSGKAAPDQLLYRDMPEHRFTPTGTDVHESGLIVLTYAPERA